MNLPKVFSFFLAISHTLFAKAADGDWASNWDGQGRVLDSAFEGDPLDARSTMRGSGQISLGNGTAIFNGSPRLYIAQEQSVPGWEQIEFTVYGKLVNKGIEPYKSFAGLTLAARTNHDNYKNEPCDAFGYYARIYQESGECSFQKEYYHSSTLGTVYTPTKRVQCFPNGLPLNQWIGMKFKVLTALDTEDVVLELYLDEFDTGDWVLKHSYIDTKSSPWLSVSSKDVPLECPQADGDTVLGPKNVCFLRTDGDITTEVHWRGASIINDVIVPPPPPNSCGLLTKKQCGGDANCEWVKGACSEKSGNPPPPPSNCSSFTIQSDCTDAGCTWKRKNGGTCSIDRKSVV